MSIDAVGFIPQGSSVEQLLNTGAQHTESSHFMAWLEKEMYEVNQQIQKADLVMQDFAVGKEDNLHHVMITMEKAKLSFELAVQVRNKLLEGYQEIMRMQV